jgi:flagellar FliJ protein
MPFRFTLAAVLRIRESLERKEQLALEQCYRHLYSVQKRLSEQDDHIANIRKQYQDHLMQGTKAVELHCLLEQRFQAERQRDVIFQQFNEAQDTLRRQIEIYRSARRQRETVGQVRADRFAQYQKHEALSEQKERDDLFLLRRQRHK